MAGNQVSPVLDAVGLAATAGLLLGAHTLAVRGCPPLKFLPPAPKKRPKHRTHSEVHRGWEPGEVTALHAELVAFAESVPTPEPCGTCGCIPHAVLIANRTAAESGEA